MATPTALDRLREERQRIEQSIVDEEEVIAVLNARLAGVAFAIDALGQEQPTSPAAAPAPKAARGEVERLVRGRLELRGDWLVDGLAADTEYSRESVAAVLRRLVKSGEVEREGERYRIARPVQDAAE